MSGFHVYSGLQSFFIHVAGNYSFTTITSHTIAAGYTLSLSLETYLYYVYQIVIFILLGKCNYVYSIIDYILTHGKRVNWPSYGI